MTALNLDPESMDIGDLEDFEAITGQSLTAALKPKPVYENGELQKDEKGRPLKEMDLPVSVIKALVFLTKRKENPAFTLDDARSVKLSELNFKDADEEGNA